jgi:hypothetical protein
MTEIFNYFRYSLLSLSRKTIRVIGDNLTVSIAAAVAITLFLAFGVDLIRSYPDQITSLLPYGIALYCVYKTFSDTPIISIPFHVLSMKTFSATDLKNYLMIKIVFANMILLSTLFLIGFDITAAIASSILMSVGSSVFSFLKTQMTTRTSISAALLYCGSSLISIYFSLPICELVLSSILVFALYSKKQIGYDQLFEYVRNNDILKTALETQDAATLSTAQQAFFKRTKKETANVKQKDYDHMFFFRLEFSRIIDHLKPLLGCYAITLVLSGVYSVYFVGDVRASALATIVLFTIVDAFLTTISNGERAITKTNPVFYRPTDKVVLHKYVPYLLVILIDCAIGIPFIGGLSPMIVIVMVLLFPVQNIYAVFAPTKPRKFGACVAKSLLLSLSLSGLIALI